MFAAKNLITPLMIYQQTFNPSFHALFMEKVSGVENLKKGDFVFFRGVSDYNDKHSLGNGCNMNAVCAGDNSFYSLNLPSKGATIKEIFVTLANSYNQKPIQTENKLFATKEIVKELVKACKPSLEDDLQNVEKFVEDQINSKTTSIVTLPINRSLLVKLYFASDKEAAHIYQEHAKDMLKAC